MGAAALEKSSLEYSSNGLVLVFVLTTSDALDSRDAVRSLSCLRMFCVKRPIAAEKKVGFVCPQMTKTNV